MLFCLSTNEMKWEKHEYCVRRQMKWKKKMVDVVFCLKGFLSLKAPARALLLSPPLKQPSNPPQTETSSVPLSWKVKKEKTKKVLFQTKTSKNEDVRACQTVWEIISPNFWPFFHFRGFEFRWMYEIVNITETYFCKQTLKYYRSIILLNVLKNEERWFPKFPKDGRTW